MLLRTIGGFDCLQDQKEIAVSQNGFSRPRSHSVRCYHTVNVPVLFFPALFREISRTILAAAQVVREKSRTFSKKNSRNPFRTVQKHTEIAFSDEKYRLAAPAAG